MSKLWSLIRVNLRMSLDVLFSGGFRSTKKKKGKRGNNSVILMILFTLLFIPLMLMMFYSGQVTTENLAAVHLESGLVSLIQVTGMFMIILTSVVIVPAVYFFAGDLSFYLAMPLRPREILGAKFITLVISQYWSLIVFFVPMVAGMLTADFSFRALFGWLISLLLLPVFPILVVSVLILLLISVAPAMRDKNRLSMLTGLFAIVFSLGIALFFQTGSHDMSETLISMIQNGGGFFETASKILLPLYGAQLMIAGKTIGSFFLGLVLTVGINVLLAILYIVFSEKLYIRSAMAAGEVRSRGKKLNRAERGNAVGKGASALSALISREQRSLFRTPVFFLNNILGAFMIPIILVVSVGVSMANSGISFGEISGHLGDAVNYILEKPEDQFTYAVLIGVCFSAFAGGANGICATAISRDAHHIEAICGMPISPRAYLFSKLLLGLLYGAASNLVILIPAMFLLPIIKPVFLPVLILSMLIGGVMINAADLWIDLIHPKLNWQDETQAVKGNFNSALGVFLGMGLVIFIVIGLFLFGINMGLTLYAGILLIVSTLLCILFLWLVFGNAQERMSKLCESN